MRRDRCMHTFPQPTRRTSIVNSHSITCGTMPREIVTVQLGQCGNQSGHLFTYDMSQKSLMTVYRVQWARYFGNAYVRNMASTRKVSLKNGPQKVETGRTCSFTRLMTNITFHGLSWLISSHGCVSFMFAYLLFELAVVADWDSDGNR